MNTLEDYVTVVDVTPRSKRPIFGRRYIVRCECGWTTNCRDYIFAKQGWREHKRKCPAHNQDRTPDVPGPASEPETK